ncbi:MAG: trigger factor [Chloroflexota bacterium]|nr:trigger factor [Chloroflexota bacterium]GIK64174.1 MAG: trigger factor [Chloroflexota bacterium]
MELQVEHLADHTAQLKVKVDPERVEQAMRGAARKVSKELRIPGFRPGKAPYHVVLNLVGREGLIREAIEDIGDDIYGKALDESGIQPYAAGEITDLNVEDGLTLTFTVPKRPEVKLGDYRALRLDYKEPNVTEEAVENAVDRTRETLAVAESAEHPAQMGDKVMLKIRGVFADSEGHVHDHEHAEDEEHHHEHDHDHAEVFIDEANYEVILRDDPKRDLLPEFSAQLVGLTEEETKSFSLSIPEDEENKEMAGRPVNFEITVNKVESMILPGKDDFLAELATNGEVKTLDGLRDKLRVDLREAMVSMADEEYFVQAVDKLLETAEITYPNLMLEDYIDDMLNDLDQSLRQRVGMPLTDYLKLINKSEHEFRQEYSERAVDRLRRSLILSELANQEGLTVDDAAVDAEIEKRLEQFGVQSEMFRQFLYQDENRRNLAIDLVSQRTVRRLIDIAKGLNPATGSEEAGAGQHESTTGLAEETAEVTESAASEATE